MQLVYMNELFCLVASRDGKSRGRPCLIDGIFFIHVSKLAINRHVFFVKGSNQEGS